MDKATVTHEGKEYTAGYMRHPEFGEWFLDAVDKVQQRIDKSIWHDSVVRTILDPVVVEHVIGGVVFEEVVERRHTMPGDWTLQDYDKRPCYWTIRSANECTILRPVRLVKVDDDDECCRAD